MRKYLLAALIGSFTGLLLCFIHGLQGAHYPNIPRPCAYFTGQGPTVELQDKLTDKAVALYGAKSLADDGFDYMLRAASLFVLSTMLLAKLNAFWLFRWIKLSIYKYVSRRYRIALVIGPVVSLLQTWFSHDGCIFLLLDWLAHEPIILLASLGSFSLVALFDLTKSLGTDSEACFLKFALISFVIATLPGICVSCFSIDFSEWLFYSFQYDPADGISWFGKAQWGYTYGANDGWSLFSALSLTAYAYLATSIRFLTAWRLPFLYQKGRHCASRQIGWGNFVQLALGLATVIGIGIPVLSEFPKFSFELRGMLAPAPINDDPVEIIVDPSTKKSDNELLQSTVEHWCDYYTEQSGLEVNVVY
ncbi:MAG TPA: hypothetical protein V6C72_02805 [Chroococcales cyanobacterium]